MSTLSEEHPADEGNESKSPADTSQGGQSVLEYVEPYWAAKPRHNFSFEILKDGQILEKIELTDRSFFVVGKSPQLSQIPALHQTISRMHAVIQFRDTGEPFLYDLGSTNGTFLNKKPMPKRKYIPLHVGDMLKFGESTRIYILNGPEEFRPPEQEVRKVDPEKKRAVKEEAMQKNIQLYKERYKDHLKNTVSYKHDSFAGWGFSEDAEVEKGDESEEEENYDFLENMDPHKLRKREGLTDKQRKNIDKLDQKLHKINKLSQEVENIKRKEWSQEGGLTDGQTQRIQTNEKSIDQLKDDIELLEEKLKTSFMTQSEDKIAVKSKGKKRENVDEYLEYSSDDDEFYNRAQPSKKKYEFKRREEQKVETYDTLKEKLQDLLKEQNQINRDLVIARGEESKSADKDEEDELDKFMNQNLTNLIGEKKMKLTQDLIRVAKEIKEVKQLLAMTAPTTITTGSKSVLDQTMDYEKIAAPQFDQSEDKSKIVLHKDRALLDKMIKEDEERRKKAEEMREKEMRDEIDHVTEKITTSKEVLVGHAEDMERKKKEEEEESQVDTEGLLINADKLKGSKSQNSLLSQINALKTQGFAKKGDHPEEENISRKYEAYAGLNVMKTGQDKDEKEDSKSKVYGVELKPQPRNRKDDDVEDDDYSTAWVPPVNQRGDGKTHLNQKFGY